MKLVNYNLLISSNYILFIILSFDFVATSETRTFGHTVNRPDELRLFLLGTEVSYSIPPKAPARTVAKLPVTNPAIFIFGSK